MKQLILIGLLLSSMMSGLRAEGPPPPRPSEVKEAPQEEPKISTGERIEIPDVGFSIIPPNGWMVHKNSHGSSLLFETPKQPNQIYQPTIQVMVFSKHRYIDEVTMKEYGDLIVEKFGKMSNRVSGYRLRDAAFQRLETGDPSILYYTEFQYDDVPIMQMHILISSATNHFVMTYTDVAKVFEDESSPGLAIAYTSMHSAQLATQPPWRWRGFAIGGGAALLVILGWFTLHFVRARRLARLGQRIEEEDSKEITRDEESQYYSRHSPATHAESHAGDDEWASSKPQSKSAAKISQVHSSHFDEDDEPEVSDVVPISTLEKSLHPGRKRRQETVATAVRHQAPPMPPPISQQEHVSQHPISNHQPMMPQGHAQQQGMPQQGMQNVQHAAAHPNAQAAHPGMPMNQQAVPQHGMPQAGMPMNQQAMPQQGMPQAGMPMNQQAMPQQGMPQAGMPMNQQAVPQQGMQSEQYPAAHPGNPQYGMPIAQQPSQTTQAGMPQAGIPMAQHGIQNMQQGMPQNGLRNTQHEIHNGIQNAQHGMSQHEMQNGTQNAQHGMSQHEMQNGTQNAQQGFPQNGMPQGQQPLHAAYPGMPEHGAPTATQPMHVAQQGLPQAGIPMSPQPIPQQGLPNTQQSISQYGMPNTQQSSSHTDMQHARQGIAQHETPISQQPMHSTQQAVPQHGMPIAQQPMQTAQQPGPGVQNASHQVPNVQQPMASQVGASFPDHEQPLSHPQVAMPHRGMPASQPNTHSSHPHAASAAQAAYSHDQQPVSQAPFQPPVASQNPFMPQPDRAMAAPPAPPVPMPETGPQGMPMAQNQVANAGYIPHAQPQSQTPASEQPAYVHQAYAPAAQAFAAPAAAPSPAPLAQTFAAPAPAPAPAMPQFAPSDDPVSEPPITTSRATQSQMNRKQPLSQNLDDEPEMTEEARLSEILPKAGTIEKSKPKRKGLFWRKKADDDDLDESSDDKAGWNVPAPKKSKGRDDDDDADADAGDEWAVTPSHATDAALAEKDDDEPAESEAWAPEATKRSEPKKNSLLNETQGPQHLARRAPQGPVTKEHNAAVAEGDSDDGWNLKQEVASDHDEEDEEEVG